MIPIRAALPVRWKVFGVAVAGLLVVSLWLRATAPSPALAHPPQAPPPHSIAVMPFLNASPDSSYDYLSEGVTGDLTSVLGRIPGLRVAGRRSAGALPGEDPVAVGNRLGVGSVLVGGVRRAGDRLRVSVHLVSVDGGFDVWSETYEREAADLLGVEGEIVASIVATLRLRDPGGEAKKPTPDAYSAYLMGRFFLDRAWRVGEDPATLQFANAIRLDSSYAPAWAGLAEAHLRRFLAETSPPGEVVPLARAAVDRALGLDSALAEARITRAILWLLYDRNPAKAANELQRAIALNPNLAEAFHWQSHIFLATGEVDSSLAASRRAIESSPLDPGLRTHLGWHYLLARQDSLSEEAFGEALALDSARTRLDEHLSWRHARSAFPERDFDSLQTAAKERYVSPYELAVAGAAAGKTRQALAALSRAIQQRTPGAVYSRLDPRLDSLRRNRRFDTMLRSIGLP